MYADIMKAQIRSSPLLRRLFFGAECKESVCKPDYTLLSLFSLNSFFFSLQFLLPTGGGGGGVANVAFACAPNSPFFPFGAYIYLPSLFCSPSDRPAKAQTKIEHSTMAVI